MSFPSNHHPAILPPQTRPLTYPTSFLHHPACRTCILALNTELSRLLEVQHAFRQLSYFDIRRRSRLSIEIARIAICLPLALERALQRQKQDNWHDKGANRDGVGGTPSPSTALLNRRVYRLLCAFSIVLERMESFF